MSEPSVQTKPIDWDFILQTLERQKCILFLGPELFKSNDGNKSKQHLFFENLAAEHKDKILSYNQDGFFLFSNPQDKTRIFLKIVDFFETQPDEDIIRKIAEIPFHTIVSINPDIALKKFFELNNHPYSFEFFDKMNKKDLAEAPTKQKPLLYNLFGSVTKEDTLILTHDELFDYFKGLMGNNLLPVQLRTTLQSAMDLIFLGFQFDKWYVQLILCLLGLNDKTYQFIRYASTNTLNRDTESLCINHFKIEFIGPDTNSFINVLHEKCEEKKMLRNFMTPVVNGPNGRPGDLIQKIERQYSLLSEYERKLDTEGDPRTIMRYEDEIVDIKKRIAQYEKEMESHYPVQS